MKLPKIPGMREQTQEEHRKSIQDHFDRSVWTGFHPTDVPPKQLVVDEDGD